MALAAPEGPEGSWMELGGLAPPPSATLSPAMEGILGQGNSPALRAAWEDGFRQGERAGLAKAEQQAEALAHRYAEAVAELDGFKAALFKRAEQDVVRLAMEVAKKVVHREIHLDRDIIQTLVRVALGRVTVRSAVTVRLNPADYNYLLEHRKELSPHGDEAREIIMVADRSVERGGCLIQNESGDVDARIEEQFREVERAFFANPS